MNALQPALATLSANKVQYTRSPPTRWRSRTPSTSSCPISGAKSGALRCSPSTSTPCPSRRSSRRRSPNGKKNAMTTDPTTAAARLVGGQIDAMKTAAGNTAGAMTGFMGMGMAAGAGGMGGMSARTCLPWARQARPDSVDAPQQVSRPAPAPADSWKCSCGATVTGKFCPECGSKSRSRSLQTAGLAAAVPPSPANSARSAASPARRQQRLDLQLRRGEQGQVLLRVRQTQARRYAQV